MPTDQDFEIAFLRLMQTSGKPIRPDNRFLRLRADWIRAGRPLPIEEFIAERLGLALG